MVRALLPSFSRTALVAIVLVGALLHVTPPAHGQSMPNLSPADTTGPLTLTADRAVEIALQRSYDVREQRLSVRNANAQVREAWGQVFPQVDASGGYTRNVVTANPFAGSDVTQFLGGGGESEWVAFNERLRQAGQPGQTITFEEFLRRQQAGLQEAGISLDSDDNPFGVDNEFRGGISVSQVLYSGSAFAAIAGAQQLKDVNQRGLDRQEQLAANQAYQAFYQALLASERVRVLEQRIERTKTTLQEVDRRVQQGVAPKFQRLSTEVELSNLETQLVQAQNGASSARDNLKQVLGLPVDRTVRLDGALEASDRTRFVDISTRRAIDVALERRADVERARLNVELRQVQQNVTRAQYLPTVSAVANFNYTGRVPDDRTRVINDPGSPFTFSTEARDFFNEDFWNPAVSVGLQLSWNLFNGFQTTARVEQDQVAIEQARVQLERLRQAVELEVRRAMRDLEAARRRIESQQQNVNRAETNYQYAEQRVAEGVSSQLELREASDQLDQSRLNYLQAIHDYLVARGDLETALGLPVTRGETELQFTTAGSPSTE